MVDTEPIRVFFSYAHADKRLLVALKTHLAVLQYEGLIAGWDDQDLVAGTPWAREIAQQMEAAPLILLLVSANFLASPNCFGVEMCRALARHKSGEARVVPIILRDCDWKNTPLGDLQALPASAKAVCGHAWNNQDEAWADVAHGMRRVVMDLISADHPVPDDPHTFSSTLITRDIHYLGLRCPRCKQVDSVQKVTAIVVDDDKASRKLASRLRCLVKPEKEDYAALVEHPPWEGLVVLTVILGFVAYFSHMWAYLELAAFIWMLLISLVWGLRTWSEQRFHRDSAAYDRNRHVLDDLHRCKRCDGYFRPGESGGLTSIEDLTASLLPKARSTISFT